MREVQKRRGGEGGTSGAEPGPHNHHSRKSACSCAGCPETPNVRSWWSDLSLLRARGVLENRSHAYSQALSGLVQSGTQLGSKENR